MKHQNKTRGKTASRVLFEDAEAFFKKTYSNRRTFNTYAESYRKFIRFCREKYHCTTKDECGEHISEYSAHLQAFGYSASTVHTYLAAVCVYHGVDMREIEKPKRHAYEYKRGRSNNGRRKRSDNDFDNPKYERSVSFQRVVGIRRAELLRLTADDLVTDESGYLCVRVKRGKGGKMQLQRILPGDAEFVKSFFAQESKQGRLFSPEELNNKINYHSLRAKNAQTAYAYYYKKLIGENGEAYRQQLTDEILRRWNKYCIDEKTNKPKTLNRVKLMGIYALRGGCREIAIEKGLPTEYDRLALMAVSVFHLSHWRVDVTVASYMIA